MRDYHRIRRLPLSESQCKDDPGGEQYRECRDAGFGAGNTASEPRWAVQRYIQQVAIERLASVAGVGLGEDHHVRVVRHGVKANREPQVAGAP